MVKLMSKTEKDVVVSPLFSSLEDFKKSLEDLEKIVNTLVTSYNTYVNALVEEVHKAVK